jgi:hypothetical protein
MSVRQKHGKGRYAYQAKKAEKQAERPMQDSQDVASDSDNNRQVAAVKMDGSNIVRNGNNGAVMPVNIGKIDLIYEIKRIAVVAAIIIVLLVILFIVLK